VIKGKAAYMAPEQARAQPLDRRADVWAAGVIAWELAAGRPMHPAGEDEASLLLRVVTEVPPRLRTVRGDIPGAVDEAIAQALRPDRTRRCPSALRLAESLEKAWAGVITPAHPRAVAEYVQAAAGDRLALRREQATVAASVGASPGTDVSFATSTVRSVRLRWRPSWAVTLVAAGARAAAAIALRSRASHDHGAAAVASTPPSSASVAGPGAPGATHSLHVTATAPVSWVRIDGNVIARTVPSTDLLVDVPEGVLRPGLVVEAGSTDGRQTRAQLGADITHVSFAFEPVAERSAAPAAQKSGHPGARTPSAHVAASPASASAAQDAPLAPSPYER
jgi:serine/threonine-protein kinase